VPCERVHVEYGKESKFVPGSCPPTERCTEAVCKLQRDYFLALRREDIFSRENVVPFLPRPRPTGPAFAAPDQLAA
jgi:hypothetical protein